MRIKQAKLAQGLKGETSNILNDTNFDMVFANSCLTVKHRNPDKAMTHGPFIVFPANLAYIIPIIEEEALTITTKTPKK